MKTYLTIFLILPHITFGFCYEPSPPWSKPSKPIVPWCVNEWTNTHTCSEWEINSYNNEIQNYNYDVQNYVYDLQNYLYEAEDYVNCEINSLNY